MTQVLQGHKAVVNCITLIPFIQNGYLSSLVDRQREAVSCDIDGSILVWKMGVVCS